MNPIMQYAIAGFLNAFMCCSAIAFLINKWPVKTIYKCIVVFGIYSLLAFVMCSGGQSILRLDMANFDTILFLFYLSGALCTNILIYVFFERRKLGQMAKSKGKK